MYLRKQRRQRRPTWAPAGEERTSPLAELWIWRILLPLRGWRKFIGRFDVEDEALATLLGLEQWLDPEDGDFDADGVQQDLRRIYQSRSKELAGAKPDPLLEANVRRLARRVGMARPEERILQFAILLKADPLLSEATDYLGDLSSNRLYTVLARLLAMPEQAVKAALSPQGVLHQSGLLTVDRAGTHKMDHKLDLLCDDCVDFMLSTPVQPMDWLRSAVVPTGAGRLSLADYGYLGPELAALRPYLQLALKERVPGVNIFIHGPPGTGKTELVKALARSLRCSLFTVSSEDSDGDPVTGMRRLRAYNAAQYFFGKGRNLMLFDEMEDVFSAQSFFQPKSVAQEHKGWVNRILERNSVPTVWVSNRSRGLDRAFVRRFKMVIEAPVPPQSKRQAIIGRACRGLLAPAHVRRLATSRSLSPALVAQTAELVRGIAGALGKAGPAQTFDLIVNKTLETQGHRPIKREDPLALPEVYDPGLVNAGGDLFKLAEGLKRAGAGRLCLYGPPGTGKTAFARWLAERLDLPVVAKRGSDLLSMWVGGTEQLLASAFAEAEREGALLLIDEVDGFLQDRRQALRSWELTQVNELLTQMESFQGIFVATTNLVEGLDQASLRRFDLKRKFDYLRPEQAWRLLASHCRELRLPLPADLQPELARLDHLTPGDFAAIARRQRFEPLESAAGFIEALARECDLRSQSAP